MVAVAVAKERTPAELRALARRERDGRVSARLLALANALDGMSREEAARAAGMDRQTRVCGQWAYLGVSWAAAALKRKEFSARAGRFQPQMCGHTTEGAALATGHVHGVSVGARCGAVAGPAFRQRVDRFHFLVAQNGSLIAGRSEKACDLKA